MHLNNRKLPIYMRPNLVANICFLFLLTGTLLLAQDPVINEIMSDNDLTIEDGLGEYTDWIEIYNPGDSVIKLGGYFLSDDSLYLKKWEFPAINLAAGAYQLVFASGMDSVISPQYWSTIVNWGDEWMYILGTEEPPVQWKEEGIDDSIQIEHLEGGIKSFIEFLLNPGIDKDLISSPQKIEKLHLNRTMCLVKMVKKDKGLKHSSSKEEIMKYIY